MHTEPLDVDWNARQRYWQRRLPRLRFGAEPVEDQLARIRRATCVLSAVATGIALGIVALFTAFRRPDVGAILATALFVPILIWAWLDDTRLHRRAAAYLRELHAHEQDH
jgi:hypothetical protein